MGISFLKQFLLVPAFILSIGGHGYAFWLSVTALIILINSLNSGHLHYSANILSIAYHKTGSIDNEIRKFQGASLIYSFIQLLLGLVFFFPDALATVTSFDKQYITTNNLNIAFLLVLTGRIVYQYFSSFLTRLFEPIGNIYISLKYKAIADAFELAVTALGIYFTKSIFFTSIGIAAVCFIFSGINYILLKKQVPFKLTLLKKIDFPNAFKLIRQSFVLNISFWVEKIYDVGLNLIIVRFFGVTALNVFSTSRVLTNIFYRAANVLILPAFPEIQKQYVHKNLNYIYEKVKLYWSISVSFIIITVTIGMPLLPYIYSFWTKNELHFDYYIVGFLIVAISLQIFGTIINEFFKKTNYSAQLLVYNVIKLTVTSMLLVLFGYFSIAQGVAIALAAGEAVSLICLLYCFADLFKAVLKPVYILYRLIPVLIFCVSVILFVISGNYSVLLFFNIPLILLFVYKKYYNLQQW